MLILIMMFISVVAPLVALIVCEIKEAKFDKEVAVHYNKPSKFAGAKFSTKK